MCMLFGMKREYCYGEMPSNLIEIMGKILYNSFVIVAKEQRKGANIYSSEAP